MSAERKGYVAMENRSMERTVWSQPGLPSDMRVRRSAAKAANDLFIAALHKALGQ